MLEPSVAHLPAEQQPNDALNEDKPLDLLVLPGIAFDRRGARLGRGRGFFDKYVRRCIEHAEGVGMQRPWLIGLCFHEQLVDHVPLDAHDQCIDTLVTPSGFIQTTS